MAQDRTGLGPFCFGVNMQDTNTLGNAVRGAIARGAKSAAAQELRRAGQKERRERAQEWKQFRKSYLYSQSNLADAVRCSRRTIVAIESEEVTAPHPTLLRRFRDLKIEHEIRFATIRRKSEEVA